MQRGSLTSSAFNELISITAASNTLLKYLFILATLYATSYPVLNCLKNFVFSLENCFFDCHTVFLFEDGLYLLLHKYYY